jgi:hypothetical protein
VKLTPVLLLRYGKEPLKKTSLFGKTQFRALLQ